MISELWSSVTCVDVALLLTPSPHSEEFIMSAEGIFCGAEGFLWEPKNFSTRTANYFLGVNNF